MALSAPTRSQLACYVAGGRVADPRPALEEARVLASLGLGSLWISERFATKELGTLCSAVAAVADAPEIVAGITHTGIRHPLVLASWGLTMQALYDNRFTLGLGRGVAARWRRFGVSAATADSLVEAAELLRRLWKGERFSYEGPLGRFPDLVLADLPPDRVNPPPLVLAAVGRRTLRAAGWAYDGVVLHPFLTRAAISRSAEFVRDEADRAGRDVGGLRVVATILVGLEGDEAKVRARAASYLYGSGLSDSLVDANGWSRQELDRLRSLAPAAELRAGPATVRAAECLAELGAEIPAEWIDEGSANGSPAACAASILDAFRAGSDQIILHGAGALPARLVPLIDSFEEQAAAQAVSSTLSTPSATMK